MEGRIWDFHQWKHVGFKQRKWGCWTFCSMRIFCNTISAAKKNWVRNKWDKNKSQANSVDVWWLQQIYLWLFPHPLWVQCLVFCFRGSDPARCLGPDLTLGIPYHGTNGYIEAQNRKFKQSYLQSMFLLHQQRHILLKLRLRLSQAWPVALTDMREYHLWNRERTYQQCW